jgi:AcrR family transcriptional regulator
VATNLWDVANGTRRSAEERRPEIVEIAMRHFARGGYHGTSTEAIAKEAGISQPYLFRLFGTKRELFLACCARARQRIGETFRAAAASAPEGERFSAMGHAYVDLIDDRDLLLFHMQMYAACSDPVIQEAVRAGYAELVEMVMSLTSAGPEEVWSFFSTGMLLNVIASLDLEAIAGEREWAKAWTTRPKDLAQIP